MSVFNKVATGRPGKNLFDLSYEKKMTGDMATLMPFYLQETVPGDSFRINAETFMRLAPTLAPIMHRVNVYTHFFFVPNRIVWDNWQSFITGGEDGQDAHTTPLVYATEETKEYFNKKTLADYMGVPVVDQTAPFNQQMNLSALPFRGYQSIFNEYYRDQNLQTKVVVETGDTVDPLNVPDLLTIRTRNWERDYLTSALPWAQKGSPIQAPIDLSYRWPAQAVDSNGNAVSVSDSLGTRSDNSGQIWLETQQAVVGIDNIDPDLTGIDINELRQAVRLQEWQEKNARAGSRYVESIMAHFGERVPDYTAQRPVYLGGGKANVKISEVLSTYSGEAANTHDLPQGNMSGHGIAIGNSNRIKASFSEHGFIFGIMSIMPRTAYQSALNRSWIRFGKYDYYWPEFAQLGEQAVEQQEVHFDQSQYDRNETFGYQARYADYKYRQSEVSGDFRDNLAFWHMGRIFTSPPALNETFVQANPRKDIFAVNDPDTNNLYIQIFNNVKAIRPMPYHNVPTL